MSWSSPRLRRNPPKHCRHTTRLSVEYMADVSPTAAYALVESAPTSVELAQLRATRIARNRPKVGRVQPSFGRTDLQSAGTPAATAARLPPADPPCAPPRLHTCPLARRPPPARSPGRHCPTAARPPPSPPPARPATPTAARPPSVEQAGVRTVGPARPSPPIRCPAAPPPRPRRPTFRPSRQPPPGAAAA